MKTYNNYELQLRDTPNNHVISAIEITKHNIKMALSSESSSESSRSSSIKRLSDLNYMYLDIIIMIIQLFICRFNGYDYQFVEKPSDDLKCLICLCVARDPQQHGGGGCGKIYCTSCIDQYKETNDKCPNCREVMNIPSRMKEVSASPPPHAIVLYQVIYTEKTGHKKIRCKFLVLFLGNRDIQSLKVKCINLKDGCQWVGELRHVDDHCNTCGYVKLPCPNMCVFDEATQFLCKDLQKHLEEECPYRQYTCPRCEETDEYEYITGEHIEDCPKMIIECSNAPHCKTAFPQETKDAHLSTCQYQEVACKYSEFGCKKMPFRKDLQEHENDDNAHLRIAMTTMLTLKKQCTTLKKQSILLNTQLQCSNMKDQQDLTSIFKMPSFKEKKENNNEFFSDPFYTHPKGYKISSTSMQMVTTSTQALMSQCLLI